MTSMKFSMLLHSLQGYSLIMVLPCVLSARDYQLEVVLKSYENPTNQLNTGHCCDPRNRIPCVHEDIYCLSVCDPYFTINTSAVNTLEHTTPVYSNTDSLMFINNVYTLYGNDTVWQGNSFFLNVAVHEYNEDSLGVQDNAIIDHFQFSIDTSSLQWDDCSFQNSSIRHDALHCDEGYIELNISYRLLESADGFSGTHCEQIDLHSSCLKRAVFHLSTNLMINPASTPSTHGTTSPTYTVTSSPVDYISPNRGLIISVGDIDVNFCSHHGLCGGNGQATESSWGPPRPTRSSKQGAPSLASFPGLQNEVTPSCTRPASSSPIPHETIHNQTNERESSLVFYGGIAVGGFMAGLVMAGIICVSVAVYLRRRARIKISQSTYFSRRERNPFYQSSEDLVDGNTMNDSTRNAYKEDNGGYDALRASRLCGSGKLTPLNRRMNGLTYCLSPTDPPVPLRAVPRSISPQYEMVKSQGPRRPQKLMLAKKIDTSVHTSNDRQSVPRRDTCNRDCNSSSVATQHSQCKNSPIYEMVELPQHAKHAHVHFSASPVSRVWAPALPKRGPLRRATKESNIIAIESIHSPLSSAQSASSESAPISGSNAWNITTRKQNQVSTGRKEEEENWEREVVSRETRESENKRNSDEMRKSDAPDDLDSLYSKVKKPKRRRASTSVIENWRNLKSDMFGDTQVDPPTVPLYSKVKEVHHLSSFVGDDREAVEAEDRSSQDQPDTPFIL